MTKSDSSMRAAVLLKLGQIQMQTRPVPSPGPDEILVRIACVGVCGSDIHYYRYGRIGDQLLQSPQCLGHECSGFVAAVGSDVKTFEIDQLVACEPSRVCGWCNQCRTGNYNLCPNVKFLGTPPIEGVFQEYHLFHFSQCFAVPDGITPAAAAMVEPFVTGFCTSRTLAPVPSHTALIIGVGAIGLSCVNMARLYSASTIIAMDKLDNRLALAADQGATHTLNVTKGNPLEFVRQVTADQGVDCVYEASGAAQKVAELSIQAAAINAQLALIGIPLDDHFPLLIHRARRKGLTIHNVRRFANCYPQVLRLLADRKIDLDSWVTHRYDLDHAAQAMELAGDYNDNVVKALIEM